MDKENKGYVSFETVRQNLHKALERYGKKVEEHEHKPGDLEKAEEICDPKHTGKVEYEGFKALIFRCKTYIMCSQILKDSTQ